MLRRIGFGLIVVAGLIIAGTASARHRHQINPIPFSHSPCSVLDGRPCTPSFCSVFNHGPCIPDIDYPYGENLQLTIQTVPSQARTTAQVGAATSKSLYQADARSGSGLDELAGIVSSGLTSNRLTKPVKSTEPGKQLMMPIIVGATVIVALLLVIIVVLALMGRV